MDISKRHLELIADLLDEFVVSAHAPTIEQFIKSHGYTVAELHGALVTVGEEVGIDLGWE